MSRRSGLTVDADASEDTSGFLTSPVSSGAGGGQTPDGRERVASDYSDGNNGLELRRPSSTDRSAPPTPTSSSAASSAASSSKNQSAVKVGIRVRPLNERELKLGDKGDAWEISENTLQVRRRRTRAIKGEREREMADRVTVRARSRERRHDHLQPTSLASLFPSFTASVLTMFNPLSNLSPLPLVTGDGGGDG